MTDQSDAGTAGAEDDEYDMAQVATDRPAPTPEQSSSLHAADGGGYDAVHDMA